MLDALLSFRIRAKVKSHSSSKLFTARRVGSRSVKKLTHHSTVARVAWKAPAEALLPWTLVHSIYGCGRRDCTCNTWSTPNSIGDRNRTIIVRSRSRMPYNVLQAANQ